MCGTDYDFDFFNEIATITITTLEQRSGIATDHPIVAPYSEAAHLITTQQSNIPSVSGINLTAGLS